MIVYLWEEVRVRKEMAENGEGIDCVLPKTNEPVWLAKPRESYLLA